MKSRAINDSTTSYGLSFVYLFDVVFIFFSLYIFILFML
jgi:hypothetical protein